jgi:hypothetical protein
VLDDHRYRWFIIDAQNGHCDCSKGADRRPGAVFHRRQRATPGNNFRLKLSKTRPIFSFVEDNMTDPLDDSRRDYRVADGRSTPSSRARRTRLTPERTAEIRLRILQRAYDSPEIAATIARRLLQRGDL